MDDARFPLLEIARDVVLQHVRDAETQIRLASPFLSADVATLLVESARTRGVRGRRMLTALTGRATSSGVLDPAALEILLDGGFAVASIPDLHAKVTLIDRRWGLVGSGNLTDAGLRGGNIELGVVLTRGQISHAVALFDGWWQKAKVVRHRDLPPYIEELARQQRRSRGRQGSRPRTTAARPGRARARAAAARTSGAGRRDPVLAEDGLRTSGRGVA